MGRSSLGRATVTAVAMTAHIADALQWPRSRPVRILAGERASRVDELVLLIDEHALVEFEAESPHAAAILMTTPASGQGLRLGRRTYDPFAGDPNDVSSWQRAERIVFDAGLLLTGGAGGIDEQLAQAVCLEPRRGQHKLLPARALRRDVSKFVGYAPVTELDHVRGALFEAGAGTIGNYDSCSWSSEGIGTFRGGENTDPSIGKRGHFEQVAESRFELVCANHLVDRVCAAYVASHSYEEPAFDVIPLALPSDVGFGRVGCIAGTGPLALRDYLAGFDPSLTVHGDLENVSSGALCLIHMGAMRDIISEAAALDALELVVVSELSQVELDWLTARGVVVIVVERKMVFLKLRERICDQLSASLGVPVRAIGELRFPEQAEAPNSTSAANLNYAVGTWRIHFDGGSRGNPGAAAYGWALYDPDGLEHEVDAVSIGTATNNVAEWTGLLSALQHARMRGIRSLQVRGDSELVVKQMTGVYKVKNTALKPLAEQVSKLAREFDNIDVQHVYRTDNARADALVNEALDALR